VIVWALAAVAAGVAIFFAALPSALNGSGVDLTFSSATPLFVLCLAVSLAAGVCAILLGGRWWTAPLVASPALIYGAGVIVGGSWVLTALLVSPLVVVGGIIFVLALPRRRSARPDAAAAPVDTA
jgi:hypothetical protein